MCATASSYSCSEGRPPPPNTCAAPLLGWLNGWHQRIPSDAGQVLSGSAHDLNLSPNGYKLLCQRGRCRNFMKIEEKNFEEEEKEGKETCFLWGNSHKVARSSPTRHLDCCQLPSLSQTATSFFTHALACHASPSLPPPPSPSHTCHSSPRLASRITPSLAYTTRPVT